MTLLTTSLGAILKDGSIDFDAESVLLRMQDFEQAYRILRELSLRPTGQFQIRSLFNQLHLATTADLSDEEICTLLARHISHTLRWMIAESTTPSVARGIGSTPADPSDTEPPPPQPQEEEVKIRDWRIECSHHASDGRALVEKGNRIAVVPPVGKTADKIKVHWRDDHRGSMPPALEVRCAGRDAVNADSAAGGGGFTTYTFDAEYHGELNLINPINPYFWRDFREKTTHTVQPGPVTIGVDVYNPRQYKFEFSFPPLHGYKAGSKYEAEGAEDIRALNKQGSLKATHETTETHWSPSSLTLNTTNTSTSPGPDFEPSKSEQKLVDTIKLTRDGGNLSVNVLETVGAILNFAKTVQGIVKMVKDYAPKVGWYIDWNLQLMQGALAVEWYWKEHTDNRVFQYIDFNAALTIFALTFEIGIGASFASFKLQIYAQLSGEMKVEAGAKRDSPDGAPGFTLPTLKGKIGGALGARAEAGYVFKFEGKGETAIEAELGMGVNQRNAAVTFDCRMRWTGISCTATVSAGLFGIGGTKTVTASLVAPSSWWGATWPKEQPFEPPTLSYDRIKGVVLNVLNDGWDIRVFDDNDDRVSNDTVATLIATRIERDTAFDKSTKMINALANGIRQDLDVLSSRWGRRDWMELSKLNSYLNSAIEGKSLKTLLDDGADPTRQLVANNT